MKLIDKKYLWDGMPVWCRQCRDWEKLYVDGSYMSREEMRVGKYDSLDYEHLSKAYNPPGFLVAGQEGCPDLPSEYHGTGFAFDATSMTVLYFEFGGVGDDTKIPDAIVRRMHDDGVTFSQIAEREYRLMNNQIEPGNTFWMVLGDEIPVVKHDTIHTARKEADRLSGKYGKPFFVMQTIEKRNCSVQILGKLNG